MKELNTQDNFDTILSYIENKREFRLSPKLEECIEIYNATEELLGEYATRGEIVKQLRERFPQLKERTADEYIRRTRELLPLINPILNPDFFVQLQLKNLMQTRRIAMTLTDDKAKINALLGCDANFQKFIEKSLPDKKTIKIEDLQEADVEIGHHPELINEFQVPASKIAEWMNELSDMSDTKTRNYTDFEQVEDNDDDTDD